MAGTILRSFAVPRTAKLRARLPAWWLLALCAAAIVGAGLPGTGKTALLAILIGVLPLAVVLSVDEPLAVFTVGIALVALYSEEVRDNSILPGGETVYASAPHSAVELLFYLLAAGYLVRLVRSPTRAWPGAPATGALVLVAAGIVATFAHPGSVTSDLRVLRDVILLPVAMCCGYWLALEHEPRRLYRILVLVSVPLLPLGLYNAVTGAGAHAGSGTALSFYDSSSIFLLGACLLLVGFEVVELHAWRLPYCFVAALVVVLSLRRGAILSLAVAALVTLLWTAWSAKSTRWAWAGAVVLAVVALEAAEPGVVINSTAHLSTYLTGSSGTDWSVNYRNFERPNVWGNVRQNWVTGIGPSGEWTLLNSYNGKFVPQDLHYVHNNFLWVWLHFGLFGLIALSGFLLTTAWTLLRRIRQSVSVTIVGAVVVGSCVMLATASTLTTTIRWPVITGVLVGIAAAEVRGRGTDAQASPSR